MARFPRLGNYSEVITWVCNCGYNAGRARPDRYFAHQDNGDCGVWGNSPKERRNKLGGVKVPVRGGPGVAR